LTPAFGTNISIQIRQFRNPEKWVFWTGADLDLSCFRTKRRFLSMRVMVVGIDGIVGGALASHLTMRGHDVFGTTRRTSKIDEKNYYLNLSESQLRLGDFPNSDAVVFCAAMTALSECRQNPVVARRINVDAPLELARHMHSRGAQNILLSTSAVFDCLAPRMSASRPYDPRGVYGALKSEAEQRMMQLSSTAVIRLTKVITENWHLMDKWQALLMSGAPVHAFAEHSFSPITIGDVLVAATYAIEHRADGIFQVSAANDITYLKAARWLANQLGRSQELVVPVNPTDYIPKQEIKRHTSLDCERLSRLTGFCSINGEETLSRVVRRPLSSPPVGPCMAQ
jgi:dTDP-4-dehydrorhamnose reductase